MQSCAMAYAVAENYSPAALLADSGLASSCRLPCTADTICRMDSTLKGLIAGTQMLPPRSRWTEPAQRPLQVVQAHTARQSTRAPEEQNAGCAAERPALPRQAITLHQVATHHSAHAARRDIIQLSLAGTLLQMSSKHIFHFAESSGFAKPQHLSALRCKTG